MSQQWSLPEKHLVAELAVGLVRRLLSILDGQDIIYPDPGYVWHTATSDFENGCNVLWRLGVAVAAYGREPERKGLMLQTTGHEKGWPPYFKFFAASEIREIILREALPTAPPLNEVLSSYLAVACNYGRAGMALQSECTPFIPPLEYAREIVALEHLGYVKRVGDAVLWTDRIAPAMQAIDLWNSDGHSIVTAATHMLASECCAALAQTPDVTKRHLAKEAKRLSEVEFAVLLRDRFEGLYLSQNPDGSPRSNRGDVRLIKAIYLALRKRL